MNLYKGLMNTDYEFCENSQTLTPNTTRIYHDRKTFYYHKMCSDYTILRDLAVGFKAPKGYSLLFNSSSKVAKAIVESVVTRWIQKNIHKDIDNDVIGGPTLTDKVSFAISKNLPSSVMQSELGIPEGISNIIEKAIESTTPDTELSPVNRLSNAVFVIEKLLEDLAKEQSFPKGESQLKTPGAATGETKTGTDSTGSASGTTVGSVTGKLNRKEVESEAPEETYIPPVTPRKRNTEAKVTEKDIEKSVKDYEAFKQTLQKALPTVTAPAVENFESEDTFDEKEGRRSVSRLSTFGERWAQMLVVHPPLFPRRMNKGFASKRLSDSGSVPYRFSDPASGRYFKETGRSISYTRGATILVDVSASTAFEANDINRLLFNYPLCTIAVYSGSARNVEGGHGLVGAMVILARNGRSVTRFVNSAYFTGGSNMVDGPAIEWLVKQRAPRIFISDLSFTGVDDRHINPTLHGKAMNNLKRCGATILADKYTAKQFLQVGLVGSAQWKENNQFLKAAYRYDNNDKNFLSNVVAPDDKVGALMKAHGLSII